MKLLRYNADPVEIDANEIVSVVAQSNSTLYVYTENGAYYVGHTLLK